MTDRLAELGKDLIEEEAVDELPPPTQALPDDLIELQKREALIKKEIERLRGYAGDIAKLVPTGKLTQPSNRISNAHHEHVLSFIKPCVVLTKALKEDSSKDALLPLLSEFRPVAAKIRKDLGTSVTLFAFVSRFVLSSIISRLSNIVPLTSYSRRCHPH